MAKDQLVLCEGGDCLVKDKCHRFNPKPDKDQDVFRWPPFKIKNDQFKCEFYISDEQRGIYESIKDLTIP